MKKFAVLKFGGSTLGNKDNLFKNFNNIKNIIIDYKKNYKGIVVVVSALSGETRRLKDIAESLFDTKDLKRQDQVLSIGENFSSMLLDNYLNSCKIKSVSLNYHNLPIYTDSNWGNGSIINVDKDIILHHLKEDNICIVPGYIGKNIHNEFTTLGFDGSDTSAIAISGYIDADVFLFKDVSGVFSANPKRVLKARQIDCISYKDMYGLSLLGARVIHPKAVEMAYQKKVSIKILPNFSNAKGTLIDANIKDKDIAGITYYPNSNATIDIAIVGLKASSKSFLDSLQSFLLENPSMWEINKSNNIENSVLIKLNDLSQLNNALSGLHSFLNLDDNKKANEVDTNLHLDTGETFDPALLKSGVKHI